MRTLRVFFSLYRVGMVWAELAGGLTIFVVHGVAQTSNLTTLYSFTGKNGDGADPRTALVVDGSGALYGTTYYGGAVSCSSGLLPGCGTVFELAPPADMGAPWAEIILHSFTDQNSDGAFPEAGVVLGAGGALYGTTGFGGKAVSFSCSTGTVLGCGTVFELAPPSQAGGIWTETVLHSFGSRSTDGSVPLGGVIFGPKGAIYGTTSSAGEAGSVGAIFELVPPAAPGGKWREPVLYYFTGGSDGGDPCGSLIFGLYRSLYGMSCTITRNSVLIPGTVFAVAPPSASGGSWTETVLHTFTGEDGDGAIPGGGLVLGAGGVLYGATGLGGAFGLGTVFELLPPAVAGGAWTENVLYSFAGGNDGAAPAGPLTLGANGEIFGATALGGTGSCALNNSPPGCGTVFKLTPPAVGSGAWIETVLYAFSGGTDGSLPSAGLTIDSSGTLYGTTSYGGSGSCAAPGLPPGCGTVFSLIPE